MSVTPTAASLDSLMGSDDFASVVSEFADALPDPYAFLAARGLELPEGADLRIIVTPQAVHTEGKHHKTCWEICVGPSWARVCRTHCTSD